MRAREYDTDMGLMPSGVGARTRPPLPRSSPGSTTRRGATGSSIRHRPARPASDEACRASTPTAILHNAFNPGGGVVSSLLVGYRAARVRVELEYLTRSQGPATAAVGASTGWVCSHS